MTFDFALAPTFVKYYCIGIVVFLVVSVLLLLWQLGWLWFKLRRVNGDLSNLNGAEEFSKGFEGYSRKAKETLGLAWTEFVETLILPESESHDPIRNTSEVSRYLNDATIVSPKIFSGFYHAVPNLLTGVGILGTFLGLAAGVGAAKSGLSSEDPRQITAALQQLLGGASLAFMTSIAGIGCSILFVFVERFTSRRLHLALGNWVGAIESRLERITPEGVALEQLDQAKRTTTQLERFNTDLIFSLEQALEEKIAGRLSPQLEQLLQAVERLRKDRATDSGQMIEQALVRFTAALQEKAGSQFEDMATTVDDLNRTLKESADAQAQTQREVRGALDSVLTSVRTAMDTGATAMTETLKQSLDEVTGVLAGASEQLATRLTASSKEAAAELRDTVSSTTQKLAETGANAASQITGSLGGLQKAAESLEQASIRSGKMLSGMDQFVGKLNELRGTIESTHQQIAGVAEPVERAARDMRESTDRTADTLEQTGALVSRVETSVTTLERHQQEIATAWTEYQRRFEGIDSSLAGVFQQFDEGLSRYLEQVKVLASELDKTTENTVGHLSSATAELSGAIEDLIPRLPGPPR